MLKVTALCTEYPGVHGATVRAARDVTFEVPTGKWFTLLGPSGCGKTTTLRSIAGLERPTSGEISVHGAVVYSSATNTFIAPNKRNFGMVFQSYAIWPHMNVFENAAFPLEVAGGHDRKEIRDKVMRVLAAVGLDDLAERDATKLSGGQQQRLALARALVREPRLLLLDEPLSNLDAKLRERMRFELKRLQQEFGHTTVYVTHDQSEALALSHQIAVMSEGELIQVGTPREIYEQPRNRFVADFVGSTNFIDAQVVSVEGRDGACRVVTELGELEANSAEILNAGDTVVLSVRPEDIELSEQVPDSRNADNVRTGVVRAKVFLGEHVDFQVGLGERVLLARAHPSLRTPVGEKIYARMNPEKCVALRQ
ncbi:MAG TPA: ABC transporter ATP-binding protein [Burkholderiales bacterium]|nr:ABC transporter ATP-binding protein [Burkholderiales bacterium]